MSFVIIGNGVAGATAARCLRKYSDKPILMISAESQYFYSRTALMYIYMGHMKLPDTYPYEPAFWEKNRIDLQQAYVTDINRKEKRIRTDQGLEIAYDKLLLSAGSQSVMIPIDGISLKNVHTLYSLQDLEKIEEASESSTKAVILGGGLIGVELAEMLKSRGISVTVVIREKGFAGHFLPEPDAALISKHLESHGVRVISESGIERILGKSTVEGVELVGGERLECDFVGITVGVKPRIELAQAASLETGRGILVDENLMTSDQDIYAAGDCVELRQAQSGRRSIEPIWYTAKMQGQTAGYNMLGMEKPYNPGIWFNSAKFFDIEYHVYGSIEVEPGPTTKVLYWQDLDEEKSLRIHYDSLTEAVIGFQSLGIRHRHQVWEDWILRGAKINEVLLELGKANFDSEFQRRFEQKLSEQVAYVKS